MEELIKRLERVIATGAPDKDGMHPISAETVLEVVKAQLSTNLAEVGTNCSEFPNNSDTISRQAAIEALNSRKTAEQCEAGKTRNWTVDICVDMIKQLPPIQPTDNLQKLADEIASFKRHVKSDNSDYLTGYLCALSVVEGMIAEKMEVYHE